MEVAKKLNGFLFGCEDPVSLEEIIDQDFMMDKGLNEDKWIICTGLRPSDTLSYRNIQSFYFMQYF